MFGGWRHYRELLANSMEGIASNILAARLKHLLAVGMITKRDDPSHKQKAIYSLTEMSIQLVPLIATMGAWGRKHLPVTEELSIRAQLLEKGGPKLWDEFMEELRRTHLHMEMRPTVSEHSVLARLNAAYDAVRARKAKEASA